MRDTLGGRGLVPSSDDLESPRTPRMSSSFEAEFQAKIPDLQQQQAAAAAAGSSSPPATLDSEMGDTRSPEANALLRSSIDAANFSHGDALFVTASGEDWVEPSRGALSDDDSVYASAGASPFGVLEGEAAGGDEVALVQAAFLDCDGDGFYGGGGAAAAAPRVPPAAAPTDGLILVGGGVGEVSANVMLSSGSARGGSLDIFGGGCSGAWALGNGNDGGAAPPAVAEISMVWPPVLCASDPAPLSITLYGGSGGAGPPCERERECESTLLVMAGASMDVVAALPVPPGAAVLTLDARQLRPRACATADKPPSAHAHAHRHPAAAAGASAPAASKAQAAVPGRQHGSPYDDGGSPSEGAGAAGTAGCGITVLTMFNILSVAGGDDDVPMQSCSPAINVLCAPPEVAAELSDHLGVMAAQLLSLRVNTHLPHLQVRDVHGFTFLPGAGSTRGAAAAAAHVHTFDVPRPPEAGSSLERGHATTSAASPQLAGDEARAPPARGGLRTLRSMPPPGSHKVRLDALGRWTVNVRRPLEAMSTLEEEAVRAAWASHFQPLVQEIAYLLTCVPGAFNDDALAWDHRTYVKALAGLVGFLEHHACWHTLSALLSHSTPLGVCLCFRGHRVRGARLGAAALQALLADATHDDVSIVFRRNASDGVHEHDGATPGGGAGGSAGVDACVDGGAGAQQQQRHASTGGVCSVGGAASGSRASGPTSLAWQSQGRSVDDGSGSGGAAAAAAAASYLCHSWDAHMLCGPHAPHAHPEGDLGLCSAMSLGDVLDKWSQEWLACEPPCCGDMRAAGSGATTLVAAPPMRAQLPPWHPACAGPASAGSAGQAAAGLPRLRHLAAAPRSNPSYGSGIDSPLAVGGGAAGHARLTTLPCVAAVSDAGWGSAALQLQLAAVLVVSTIAAGCASSAPTVEDAKDIATVVAPVNGDATPPAAGTSATPKANSTRARRLSYIDQTQGKNIPVPVDCEEEDAAAAAAQEEDLPLGAGELAPGSSQPPTGGGDGGLRVSVACMSRAGKEPGFKKTNQDNCFAFEKYIFEGQSLFGALDGHGPHGHLVSGYVKQHLPMILVNRLTTETDVMKAMSASFLEAQDSLQGTSRIDCEFSGSTAVVSFLKGTTLTTAWVGDSRGVIGRESPEAGWEAIDLTEDHKPANPEEQARILASNGRVERLVDELGEPMGPHRVWLQYAWIPGLAMSRALGDVLAHTVGVSSQPEHSVVELDPTHKFMILASDGVWEFINSAEAVDIVRQCDTIDEGCRALVDQAYQRWLTEEEGVVDDITAVVVKFHF
ncbi:hypothetical protein FOA52_000061 [Chlamydomonas sp. UWO 241]|nr:hypothetical protein FOA52_000061 [Chlamydomonas sp. UWO 241]